MIMGEGGEIKEICRADKLANLVKDSIHYYEEDAKAAREKAAKTKEEVAAEIVNEYAEENRRIKSKLDRAVAILASEKELEAYRKFCDEHKQCLSSSRAHWGRVPYVVQMGTGVGVCSRVVCQVCGEEQDITDMDVW